MLLIIAALSTGCVAGPFVTNVSKTSSGDLIITKKKLVFIPFAEMMYTTPKVYRSRVGLSK